MLTRQRDTKLEPLLSVEEEATLLADARSTVYRTVKPKTWDRHRWSLMPQQQCTSCRVPLDAVNGLTECGPDEHRPGEGLTALLRHGVVIDVARGCRQHQIQRHVGGK
jgi:hypothetical protein